MVFQNISISRYPWYGSTNLLKMGNSHGKPLDEVENAMVGFFRAQEVLIFEKLLEETVGDNNDANVPRISEDFSEA